MAPLSCGTLAVRNRGKSPPQSIHEDIGGVVGLPASYQPAKGGHALPVRGSKGAPGRPQLCWCGHAWTAHRPGSARTMCTWCECPQWKPRRPWWWPWVMLGGAGCRIGVYRPRAAQGARSPVSRLAARGSWAGVSGYPGAGAGRLGAGPHVRPPDALGRRSRPGIFGGRASNSEAAAPTRRAGTGQAEHVIHRVLPGQDSAAVRGREP
jgi:hypothetical protein